MGDSITEGWGVGDPSLFSGAVVDRGISGQTSPQMLVRFYQDVVALHPQAVHIMAGTNDVAGNTGPSSPDDFKNNIRAMVDLAKANHIQVVLASILPAERFAWRPDIQPVEQIRRLNAWLRQYASQHKLIYADYYSSLTTRFRGVSSRAQQRRRASQLRWLRRDAADRRRSTSKGDCTVLSSRRIVPVRLLTP